MSQRWLFPLVLIGLSAATVAVVLAQRLMNAPAPAPTDDKSTGFEHVERPRRP